MCGITGFVDFRFNTAPETLDKMRDSLIHRGPDNKGAVIIRNNYALVGMAHRRLSIIDLSDSGNQPMTDETGDYVIVFNGEIYNFRELKKELESAGLNFSSHSDTEVALKAYIHWGLEAANRFIGMFAFCIYDKKSQELILCRDRAGVKPLYYSIQPDLILFGSELKSLMAHPEFPKKIDFDVLATFFRRGWIASPYAIFESTFKVKPGYYLKINLSKGTHEERRYWDVHIFFNEGRKGLRFEEAKEQLRSLLRSACEYRMVADTQVGIFLSGGFDSSLVTAILQKNRTEKIHTFSIGFEEDKFDEAPYAMAVAQHLGTNHHTTVCSVKEALALIPELPEHYDEPFADSSALPTMLVSKLASQYVKVALSADGGDEVFGGYPRYYDHLAELEKVKALPEYLRKLLAKMVQVPYALVPNRNPHKVVRLEKLQKSLGYQTLADLFRYRTEPIHFSDREVKTLLRKKDISVNLKTFYDNLTLTETLDPAMLMMAIEYKTTLVDDLLVKVDRATMAYSLEGREPLLDHRLVEFSAGLNSNFHYRNMKTKALLREICYEYIPREMMDRPKKGFSIPTNAWLKKELKEMVMDLAASCHITRQDIFHPKAIKNMIDNYYQGYDRNGERIWFFLMFQLWYNKWM